MAVENKYGRPAGCSAEIDDETGRCVPCGLGWLLSAKEWPACSPMTVVRYRDTINRAVSQAHGSFVLVHALAKDGRAADPAAALKNAMELEAVRRAFMAAIDDPQIRTILKRNLATHRPAPDAEDNNNNG